MDWVQICQTEHYGKFGFIISIRLGPVKAQDNFEIGESRSGATPSTFVHVFVFFFFKAETQMLSISTLFTPTTSILPPPNPQGVISHRALIHIHPTHQKII